MRFRESLEQIHRDTLERGMKMRKKEEMIDAKGVRETVGLSFEARVQATILEALIDIRGLLVMMAYAPENIIGEKNGGTGN